MAVLNKSAIVEFLALKLTKISLGTNTLKIRDFVDRETLSSIYNALIRPHFDYCSEVWDTLVGLSSRLQELQNRAARIIMNLRYNTPGIKPSRVGVS
jgi:hypothetical protein